jgi:transposase
MLDAETSAEIRRLYYAEHWKIGTIATAKGVHPDAVRRALSDPGVRGESRATRAKITDAFLPLIRETLERYPRLRATRLYQMLRERGYRGSAVQLRRVVRAMRPSQIEAFAVLTTLPGESAQADWADFGPVTIGSAERRLSCFVMTLSYSRAIYAEFFLDQTLESFLRGHVHAFAFFGGAPRRMLTDNLRSVVLERRGDQFRFHPRYLELAGQYLFQPAPCRPARGNEKGRVERSIRYLRDSFFAGRTFSTLAAINGEVLGWIGQVAHARAWIDDPSRTVEEIFREEQPRLLSLPQHPPIPLHRLEVQSGKTHYVRFDRNDYSIPPTHVRRPLTLLASDTEIRILEGASQIARHERSWDRGRRVTDPRHIEALLASKRKALGSTSSSPLEIAVPQVRAFLDAAFPSTRSTSAVLAHLTRLHSLYGSALLATALREATERNTPTLASVEFLIERARRAQQRKPALEVDLTARPDLAALHVQPHQLEIYDRLTLDGNEQEPDEGDEQ